MSKRARYDGPFEAVQVFDPEGSIYDPPVATVERGKWLPDDVPARIRDELIAGGDWSEVKDSSSSSSSVKKES